MKLRLTILLTLLIILGINGQVITSVPAFPTESDSIVVIFNIADASNTSLVGYTGDVYTHTGVNSSSGTWQHVIGSWGDNSVQPKLTRIGTDLYQLVIGYPREFYNITNSSEHLTSLNFVLRSADATKQTEDLFLSISTGGLDVAIIQPSDNYIITWVEIGDPVTIEAASANSDSLYIFLNDSLIAQTAEDTLTHIFISSHATSGYIIARAVDSQQNSVGDSARFAVSPATQIAELPAGIIPGINYTSETSVILSLFAPNKKFIYAAGDFNDWDVEMDYYLKRTPNDSTYWLEITGLSPGEEYAFQYVVDGDFPIADPYSEKILDPWNDQYISDQTYPNLKEYPFGKTVDIVSVLQTDQEEYSWQVNNFERPDPDNLIIYELLVRDFVASHSYNTLIDTLDYLETLGVNAIELMPITEFEGNISWGYNPSFMFAVDKYYGTREALKRFIDECHARGIAVILDMVLNHQFGQSPLVRLYWDSANNRPSAENPWFNPVAKHPFNVGYDMNHESPSTQQFVDRVNRYWLEEYKFDGYRFDLSKGFMQTGSFYDYNASRIALLKRMADQIWEYDNSAYLILEHLGANDEEKVLANYGFMLWGKMTENYNEATMGYHDNNKSDLSWISYKERGWNDPRVVGYMESHDEERLMYKNLMYGNSNGDYKITELATALQRMKMAGAFFFTIPGPKNVWQFGELGYDYSINYPSGTSDDRLTPKPIRWDYFEETERYKLYRVYSELINLKKNYEVFSTDNFTLDVSGTIKQITLNHESMDACIIGNFGVSTVGQVYNFPNAGTWYDFFSGDSATYSSSEPYITLKAGEFHIFTTVKLPTPEGDILSDIIELDDELPLQYSLAQNYPNPFNPTTSIEYRVASSEKVSLKVFDVLGREISSLVNKVQAPGTYEIEFDGNNLSSGIYFYRIEAGNFIQTKKMTLLK